MVREKVCKEIMRISVKQVLKEITIYGICQEEQCTKQAVLRFFHLGTACLIHFCRNLDDIILRLVYGPISNDSFCINPFF